MTIDKPTRTETLLPNGNWRIDVKPPEMFGMPTQSVELTPDQMFGYRRWQAGDVKIQDALASLTPDQRETLISGVHPVLFDHMFKDDE